MKIAIQGHPTKGNEVIQILESLGGKKTELTGTFPTFYHLSDKNEIINNHKKFLSSYKLYTLEEFEKEFPFKLGDKVRDCSDDEIGVITDLTYIDNMLIYNVNFVDSGQAFMPTEQLKPYKEMKEERNIKLTFDKAQEWYKKGGELKEIALQAFSEKELNPLPRSWEEFCKQGNPIASWRYSIPTKYEALYQLEQLRNCWWDDWKPIWGISQKWCIRLFNGVPSVGITTNISKFLTFPTKEMAEEFLKCFKDLIEKAGNLI